MNLAQVCLARPDDSPALVFRAANAEPLRFSTAELRTRILRLAGAIEKHTSKGARILIRLKHGADFAAAFLAAIAAGRISVPLSPMLTPAEVQWIAHNAEAQCMIVDPELPCPDLSVTVLDADSSGPIGEFMPMDPDDPAFLVYTSGTSGTPRGVLHAHRNILGRRPMTAGWTGLSAGDRMFHAGMLNWSYTLGVGLMDPLREGACAVLAETVQDPGSYLQLIEEERISIFAAVPGLYRRILKYGDFASHNLASLRHCLTAGASLSEELYAAWRAAAGCELYEALGMTEISTYISSGPLVPVRPGFAGKVQPGRDVAVLDPQTHEPASRGVLCVHKSDPGLMLGYWQKAPAEDHTWGDYFVTGDFASVDRDGYIRYEGRQDEMMNASGYRVSPLEVERVISLHEAVLECACAEVDVPEKDLTIICAFVVLKQGFEETVRSAILEFAAELLARYKMPREIVFLPELPRNANGKLLRKALQALK